MAFNSLITCPADCDDDLLLPAIPENQDCTSYDQTLSQLSDLFIIPDGAADIWATWSTTPTYVADSVDNTVADNSAAHWLVGRGELPAPEKTTVEYPKLKSKTTKRIYTITYTVLNLSATQYEWLRKMQCGWTGFTFYYADLGDWVYGKAGGLSPSFVDVDFPKGGGNGDVNQAIITLRFEANGDPDRRVNPFAG
jgi:hypothetical protein